MNEQPTTKPGLKVGQRWLLRIFRSATHTRYYIHNPDLLECLNLGYARKIPNSRKGATELYEITDEGINALYLHP